MLKTIRKFFRSIKNRVRVFFAINIALVVVNYALTTYSNNVSLENRKYVQVSKENEKFIEQLSFIVESIGKGQGTDLKPKLKKDKESFIINLQALQSGGQATIGTEQIVLNRKTHVGKNELEELNSSWQELNDLLNKIYEEEILIDSVDKEQELTIEPQEQEILPDSLVNDSIPIEHIENFQIIVPEHKVTYLNPEVSNAAFQAGTLADEVLSKNRELSQLYEDNFVGSQANLRSVLLVTFLLNLIVLIGGTFVIGTYLVNPLKRISATAKDVASGDVNVKVDYKRKDEIGEVTNSLNLIVNSFQQYTEFAEDVGHGNFESNFDVKSEKDTLGYTLLSMRDSLKRVAEEDKKRNWANEGFALFSGILRSTDKAIEDFCYDIISNLVKYVDANQGGVFLLMDNGEDKHYLEMKAGFAYNRRKYDEQRIEVGQGLLGQVVLEKDTIYLDKVPDTYVKVTSGLGKSNPRSILIVPLKNNEEIYGALEIASFKYFEKYEIDFINQLSENIASTISSVRVGENTKRLLNETRQYAEQMQAQEEEMRQNMEELATTQEEMERNQRNLEAYKENLEKEVENRTLELKDKESILSNTLSQLQGIINSSKSGIVALNTEYHVVAANNQIQEIIQLVRNAEFEVGDNWFKIFQREEDQIHAKKLWNKALTGEYYNVEESFLIEGIGRKWYDLSFNPIRSENKEVIGASMFARDITARRLNQKNIELTAHILDNSTNEVYVFDATTLNFVMVNEKGRKNLGYTMEELERLTPYEIEPRFNRESFEEHISPLKDGLVEYLLIDTIYHRKDGSTYDVELNLQLFEDEDKPLFAAIVQDTTQRKQYEQQLKEALERFDLATSATKEGLWEMPVIVTDPVNPDNPAWWSRRFMILLGFEEEEEELEQKLNTWSSRLHPDDRERVLRAFYNHIMDKTGQTPFNLEYRLLNKEAQYIWVASTGETLRDEDGTPRKIAGSIRNIDRRKQAEEELMEQTAIVNGILNAAVNSIISIDIDSKVLSANAATEKVFGYEVKELIGQDIHILFAEGNQLDFRSALDTVTVIQGKRKDGSIFPLDVSISETNVRNKKIYVGILRDATQKTRPGSLND